MDSMNPGRFTLSAIAAAISVTLFSPALSALTLPDYVGEVVATHPQVQQSIHHYRQVMQDQVIANKGWRPSVDLTASAGKYQTKSPITNQERRDYDSNQAQLTLTQNLFAGYDTTNQIEQNQARLDSAMYNVYDQADNIALDATKAYLEALKQRRLLKLAEENVEFHERIFAQIQERTRSGVGRRSEEEQTAGRLAQARAGLIAQRNNLQDSLTVLHRYLGRYLQAGDLVEPTAPGHPGGSLEQLLDRALQQHPAIKVSHYNISASQANYERSKSRYLPQLDLQLQGLTGNDLSGYDGATEEYSVSLNLTYNLYNGGADQAEQRKRISAVYENTEYAHQVRREVIESMRLAWMAEETLADQLGYLSEHVERADETATSYQEEVFLGHRDLTDLLDAKSELNSAMRSRVEAKYKLMDARFRLQESFGHLFDAMGLDVAVDESGMELFDKPIAKLDTLPTNDDRDADEQIVFRDQCDNSLPAAVVTQYGCVEQAVIVENLNFIFDTTELVPASQKRLQAVITRLKRVENADITVVAHTDGWGSDEYNQELSQRRAEAIREELIAAGLDGEHIEAVGKGEMEPIADNRSDEGRAKNRRVEFIITRPKATNSGSGNAAGEATATSDGGQ